MNKSMLVGLVAGIAVATAGGVTAFALLGDAAPADELGSAIVVEETVAPTQSELPATAQPSPAVSRDVSQAAPRPVAAAPASAPPVVQEECWDEVVTVQVDPKDEHAIAGTAAGAVIGGVLADKISDDNDLATAAGAAAGAFFGRRAQLRRQENNTTTTIERRCAPVGSR